MVAFLMLVASTVAFSPLLSPKVGTPQYTWLREAEKKHSRAALVAAPSLAIIAIATGDDPIPWLNHQPLNTQLSFYSVAGLLESFNLRRIGTGFTLKEGEDPGRLLPITSDTPRLDSLEDAAGRVAMLGVAITMTSSLVNSIPLHH